MAVTRIKNNQITDSTITYQKIATGTLVGSLFNANLTLNSNVSIVGNLQVTGNTTTINSLQTLVKDPVVIFNSGFTGSPSYDIGVLADRNLSSLENYGGVNTAWIWREADSAWEAILTTDAGGSTPGQMPRSYFANVIAGNLTAANTIYATGAQITNLSVSTFTPQSIVASGNIVAASGTSSTNVNTGAIVVPSSGGVGITGNLHVGGVSDFTGNMTAGNILVTGNINVTVGAVASSYGIFYGDPTTGAGALYAGIPGFTPVVNTIVQFAGNTNIYSQLNLENIWNGPSSTSDYVLTTDDGTDIANYGDFGITSSTYDGSLVNSFSNGPGTAAYARDIYLIGHGDHASPGTSGGNLILGTAVDGKVIRVTVGGSNLADIVTTTTSSGLEINVATASTGLGTGALRVGGGASINGNVFAAAINNTPIGNAQPSSGAFTSLSASSFSVTDFSSSNAAITGGYATGLANVLATTANVVDLNATAGNVTTLYAANFSTGNARITGGYADNFPIGANTAAPGAFTYANASSVYSTYSTIYEQNATYANITNASIGNVTATTTTSTNFSTGNAVITGGYADNFPIGANTAATGAFTTLTTNTLTLVTLNATNANLINANSTTFVATNLSSGNVVITGGYIQGVANVGATEGQFTNFSTGNAVITGGYADNFPIGANTATTGKFTELVTATSNIGGVQATAIGNVTPGTGAFTTLTASSATTFTSSAQSDSTGTGAVVVTGGLGVGANVNIGGNLVVTGNLTIYGNTTTLNTEFLNVEDLNITVAANATTGAQADGAGLTVAGADARLTYLNADDSWNLNKKLNVANITANLNAYSIIANSVSSFDLLTGNASIANAVITGGYIQGLANIGATEGQFTDLSSGNAVITGGYADNFPIGANTAAPATFTYANATSIYTGTATIENLNVTNANLVNFSPDTIFAANLSSGNAVITGGYADNFPIGANTAAPGTFTYANATSVYSDFGSYANLNATNGNIITLIANNFSSGNTWITSGYADNFKIGPNTATTASFTSVTTSGEEKMATLNVTGNAYLSPQSGGATVTINPLVIGSIDNMSIGQSSAGNVYASNFKATTSLFAAPTGTIWLKGGTGTSGINNIPIGETDPAAGTFTTTTATTVNSQNLNVTNGNITTLVATNFSSGNIVATGNVVAGSGTSSTDTTTGALVVVGGAGVAGALNVGGVARFNGGNVFFPGYTAGGGTTINQFGIYNEAVDQNQIFQNATNNLTSGGGLWVAGGGMQVYSSAEMTFRLGATLRSQNTPTGGTNASSQNITFSSAGQVTIANNQSSTSTTTGALILSQGGLGVAGNLNLGGNLVIGGAINSPGNIVINSTKSAATDFVVRGANDNTLFYAVSDTTYDQVAIGGNLTVSSVSQGAKLIVNTIDSMIIPVGATSERPSSLGYTDVTGMFRFNTTKGDIEYYTGANWFTPGQASFNIFDAQYYSETGDIRGNVDGVNDTFTLPQNASTNATIVTINGVTQVPSVAYSIVGDTSLVFTEPPAVGDYIDARIIFAGTTVSQFASPNGFHVFNADNTGLIFQTGNVLYGSVQNWKMDVIGDMIPLQGSNIGNVTNRADYIFAGNLNLTGTITGGGLSAGSLDDTVIGANIARLGAFTTLYSDTAFQSNTAVITNDKTGRYVTSTDAVASFDKTKYRSGKFFIQLSDTAGGAYQSAEVICVHNDSVATIETYGVTYTGAAELATFTANVAAGTVYINATTTGANLTVKAAPTLMLL